jgi:hypothetical protein
MKEDGIEYKNNEPDASDEDEQFPVEKANSDIFDSLLAKLQNAEGTDHGKAMDELHRETLEHSRNIADLAFNVDDRARRGMLEQAANFYKVAMDAKNSKRDAQLKAWKLLQDQQRIDLEERKFQKSSGEIVDGTTVDATAIVVDRNVIIQNMLDQMKADKKKDDEV